MLARRLLAALAPSGHGHSGDHLPAVEPAYMDCDCRSLTVRHGIEGTARCRFFWPRSDFGG